MSSFCRAVTASGDICDCEEYSPSEDPAKPLACAECTHGRSKHPKKLDESTGKNSVLKLFQGVTGKKGSSVTVEQARSETLDSFTKKSTSAASGSTAKTTRKGKTKVRSFGLFAYQLTQLCQAELPDLKVIQVSSVVAMVDGIDVG
jgi:hypothetical protein